jgi:ATP-dependent phosphoenolpyruvate carboxykinase
MELVVVKLKYTRSMITAALNGELDNVAYKNHVVLYCYPTRMS